MKTRGYLVVAHLAMVVVTITSVVSARRAWGYAQGQARSYATAADVVQRQTRELQQLRQEVVIQSEQVREVFHAGAAERTRLVGQLQAAIAKHRACEGAVTPGFRRKALGLATSPNAPLVFYERSSGFAHR